MAAPTNCHREYRLPKKIRVKTMTHAIVKQSNIVALVNEENCKALLTVSKHLEVSDYLIKSPAIRQSYTLEIVYI